MGKLRGILHMHQNDVQTETPDLCAGTFILTPAPNQDKNPATRKDTSAVWVPVLLSKQVLPRKQ